MSKKENKEAKKVDKTVYKSCRDVRWENRQKAEKSKKDKK